MTDSLTGIEKNLIIDTDVGCDDAFAIALALVQNDVKVHAITTVFGNVDVDQVVKNVSTIIRLFGHPHIPIYNGAASPLVAAVSPTRWEGHGDNGMGGSDFTPELSSKYPQGIAEPSAKAEPAVLALIRMVTEKPNFYDILALGPLTNIALACKVDPDFPKKCRSLVWMGGSASGKGNVSHCAEFNAHSDADAAHIVLESWVDEKVTMVPWELCVYGALNWDQYHYLTDHTSEMAKFMKKISIAYEKYTCGVIRNNCHYSPLGADKVGEEKKEETPHVVLSSHSRYCPADVYALFVYLHPEAVTRSKTAHCLVETSGSVAKGYIAVDWFGRSEGPKTNILRNIDTSAFVTFLAKNIGADPTKALALSSPVTVTNEQE